MKRNRFTDTIGKQGGSFTYKDCEAGSQIRSNIVTVTL